MMWKGTPSGVLSAGRLAGGTTGGHTSGKDSFAAATTRLVLPTFSSPITAILTAFPASFTCHAGSPRTGRVYNK